jgi:hypothetical protein
MSAVVMATILPPGSPAGGVETTGVGEAVGVEAGPEGVVVGVGSGDEHAAKASKRISKSRIALGWDISPFSPFIRETSHLGLAIGSAHL